MRVSGEYEEYSTFSVMYKQDLKSKKVQPLMAQEKLLAHFTHNSTAIMHRINPWQTNHTQTISFDSDFECKQSLRYLRVKHS